MDETDVLVIGAGLAGLAFAGDAKSRGLRVRLLDKARGVGGRASTRRWDTVRIDHGAQFFTARGARLRGLAEEGIRDGWLRVWSHGFPLWEGEVQERPAGHPRYAPPDGMNRLPKRLAQGLDVCTETRIVAVRRGDAGWTAHGEKGDCFTARRLVLNLPPAQIAALIGEFLDTAPLADVVFDPVWAVLVRLEKDLDVGWPALETRHPVLSWVSRDHTKRQSGAPPTLVLHAQGAWSTAHLEATPEFVRDHALTALTDIVGPAAVTETQCFRWRYAHPTVTYSHKYRWDSDLGLGWCGDWCGGPRVEGALESGWHLAEAIVSDGKNRA